MSVHSLHEIAKNISHKRWTNEFTQGEKIGKGGFASVYRAKNQFDQNDYAVKKIKLHVNTLKGNIKDELERVLTEPAFLARVNHRNVLRYHNSWLEIGTKRKELAKPRTHQYGKNKGEWREVCSDEESEDISTYDSFGDLDSPAVVFDRSSEDEHDNDHFIFEEKVECSQSTAERFSKGPSIMFEDVDAVDNQKESAKSVDPVLEALSAGLSEEETIEKIILFIQTELCSETLGDYIASRNQKLASLETRNPDGYQKAWKEYSEEAIVFAKHILEGLAHIHVHGIIHRDLKPQNILLSNKVCKIGDFGLIKVEDPLDNMKGQRDDCDSPQAGPKANAPSKQKEQSRGAIGTQIFASPEQWEGDSEKFDFKSDIFSLGIVLLLLFHPVSTTMEELHVIKDSKNGKLPAKLEKDLPEIARIIKKMLAVDPCDRPSLEAVSSSLTFQVEMNTELSGVVTLKREDSEAWNNKHFKLIGNNFYVFNSEHDKKAENVYVLSEWTALLENNSNVMGTSLAYITLEDPMRLGCTFRMESCEQTNELFNHLRKHVS